MVARLPLLELTSCQCCENIIPLNMLTIHQVCVQENDVLHIHFSHRKHVDRVHQVYIIHPDNPINNYHPEMLV